MRAFVRQLGPAILGILVFLSLVSLAMVFVLRWRHERQAPAAARAASIGD